MSEEKLQLDIVTPYGSIYSGEVDEVTATGCEGEFGVLPTHAPYVTCLKSGLLMCKEGATPLYFFVSWGFAEVGPDKVVILADSAERSADIDVQRAHDAHQRAEEELKHEDELVTASAEGALERAAGRIHVAEHFGQK